MTKTKGWRTSFGIMATLAAPTNELMVAHTATTAKSFHSKRTLRAKETAEVAVPTTAANLLVPNKVAGAIDGNAFIKAGIWISPPPPTAASIAPAQKAKKIRLIIMSMSTPYPFLPSDIFRL